MTIDLLGLTKKHFGMDTEDYFNGLLFYDNPKIDMFTRYMYSRYLMNCGQQSYCNDMTDDFKFRMFVCPSFEAITLYYIDDEKGQKHLIRKQYSQNQKTFIPEHLLELNRINNNQKMTGSIENWIENNNLLDRVNMNATHLDGTSIFIEVKKSKVHKVIIIETPETQTILDSFDSLCKSFI